MTCVSYRLQPAPRKPVTRKGARRRTPATSPVSSPFPSTAWLEPEESTWARCCDRRARDAIRSLLAGRPRLQPAHFDTYAEWSVVIAFMAAAYGYYGPEGARIVYDVMAARHPELAALLRADAANPAPDGAALRTQGTPCPRCVNGGELLHGILPIGVTLLTGPLASGTTWLAQQWALAIARGHTVAQAGSTTGGAAGGENRRRVLYLALDDGAAAVERRFAQLQAPAGLPLDVVDQSPTPLRATLMHLGAQMPMLDLVVIDSLTTFLGPDPGAAAVHDALARLHILAMAGRSAVLLVDHHTYPLPPAAAPATAPAALDPDSIAAGLSAADAACQIETVYRLSRLDHAGDGDDEPSAVLTALDSPIPIVLPRHPDLNRGPGQAGSTPGASSEAAQ